MKTLIKILFLNSFLFAEDVYPYFSNLEKQLEFEKVRIYTEEVEEKEMFISGGAQFNFSYLVDSNQPITIPSPIKTDYIYSYKFEIKQNNQLINEQDFLIGIGLEKEAQEILEKQISNYFNITFFANEVHKKDLNNSNIEIIKKTREFNNTNVFWLCYSIFWHTLGAIWGSDYHALALLGHYVNWEFMFNHYDIEYKRLDMKEFSYNQTLSNEQIISLSESFNKKMYEKIKNK